MNDIFDGVVNNGASFFWTVSAIVVCLAARFWFRHLERRDILRQQEMARKLAHKGEWGGTTHKHGNGGVTAPVKGNGDTSTHHTHEKREI